MCDALALLSNGNDYETKVFELILSLKLSKFLEHIDILREKNKIRKYSSTSVQT